MSKKSKLLIILILIFSIISFFYINFKTLNPFSTSIGLIKIFFTDTKYYQIQNSPKVIISKPGNAWNLFLTTIQSDGYTFSESYGSINIIKKDKNIHRVSFSTNKYFSLWKWE